MEGEGEYTISQPTQRLRPKNWPLLRDLKPYRSTSIPIGSRLPSGHLGHIHQQRTRMVDVWVCSEAYGASGCDWQGAGSEDCGAADVAAEVGGSDVRDGVEGVVAGPLADVLPLGACDAVLDDGGEVVVCAGSGEEGEEVEKFHVEGR